MRKIDHHKLNEVNNALNITVLDKPGQGGACHEYKIECDGSVASEGAIAHSAQTISFQNGPLKENGVNGITNESLLAILIDRAECFMAGPFPSPDTEEALDYFRLAMDALQRRTKERLARGVEGLNLK